MLNGMAYVRPPLADMDGWAAAGCTGWDGASCLPYLTRSEATSGHERQGVDQETVLANDHGLDGPQSITWGDPSQASPVSHAFIAGCAEVGQAVVEDYNAPHSPHGVGRLQFYQRDSRRAHSGREFVEPLLGGGALELRPQSYATRLIWGEGTRVTGVEYIDGSGQQCFATATTKVVVAGGSFASPALLLRSGIGCSRQLGGHGIDTVVELPGVGENMGDHIWCPAAWPGITCSTRTERCTTRPAQPRAGRRQHVASACR
eukprot:COSAG04_NODE_272_length_18495_cov_17.526256_12_plen_260_part_00